MHAWLPVFVLALILCLPALWNGQPFFYPDTPTYLRGAESGAVRIFGPQVFREWLPAAGQSPAGAGAPNGDGAEQRPSKGLTSVDEKIVLAGRSVYYGSLVYAGYLMGGMWLTVAVQALAVAWVLHLLMVRLWRFPARQVLFVGAGLSLLTPLGAYAGFLMPDVFAGLSILVIGIFAVYWEALARGTRWALALLLLFSLSAHASHVALAAALLLVLAGLRAFQPSWRGRSFSVVPVVLTCIALALAADWAFSVAVKRALGEPPLRLPHLTARLIDMGPGTDYLRKHCPGAGFAACTYLPNYPTQWAEFLFSERPDQGAFALADADTKRRLSSEQLRLAIEVLRDSPLRVVRGIAADVLRQLATFRVDIARYGRSELAKYLGRVPDDVYAAMQKTRAAATRRYNKLLTLTTYATVLAAVGVAAWLLVRRRAGTLPRAPGPAADGFYDFAVLVVAGVVANAVVCGALASSLDRFQARVVWLLPLLAVAGLLLRARSGAVRGGAVAGALARSNEVTARSTEGTAPGA